MHVSFLNTYLNGGAFQSALNLFQSLNRVNFNLSFIFKAESPHEPCKLASNVPDDFLQINSCLKSNIFQSAKSRFYYKSIKKKLKNKPQGYEQFSPPKQVNKLEFSQLPGKTNIIHLHWISDWFDYNSFFTSVPEHIPIVWTLHDMNPFTGGCHFSDGCKNYISNCENCKQLASPASKNFAVKNLNIKKQVLQKKNITIISPSKWLMECSKKSNIFNHLSHQIIPNGINTEIFSPISKDYARDELDLPKDKPVILFIAQDLKSRRKGFQYLLDAIKHLAKTEIIYIVVGDNEKNSDKNIINLGYIKDKSKLAKIYSAADVYVTPAIEDNLPNTVLEAMSCGTPVVAFNIGGMPDMVVPTKTGLLAEPEDSIDLANKINHLVKYPNESDYMSKICRKLIEEKFSLNQQSERYQALYQRLIEK